MVDQGLDEGHLLPGVLHDDDRVLGGAAQEVRGKHHREVGGIHLGDSHHVRGGEELQKPEHDTHYYSEDNRGAADTAHSDDNKDATCSIDYINDDRDNDRQ